MFYMIIPFILAITGTLWDVDTFRFYLVDPTYLVVVPPTAVCLVGAVV
jgi:hypothetical protein